MSEKEDLAEVTVKVPKKIIDALEELAYFGWTPDKFVEHALRAYISNNLNALEVDLCHELEERYDPEIYTHALGPIFCPEDMLKRIAKL